MKTVRKEELGPEIRRAWSTAGLRYEIEYLIDGKWIRQAELVRMARTPKNYISRRMPALMARGMSATEAYESIRDRPRRRLANSPLLQYPGIKQTAPPRGGNRYEFLYKGEWLTVNDLLVEPIRTRQTIMERIRNGLKKGRTIEELIDDIKNTRPRYEMHRQRLKKFQEEQEKAKKLNYVPGSPWAALRK